MSAKVVSFLNQKGGVGKTAISFNTAYALAKRGHKVLLIDSDPQNSILSLAAAREMDEEQNNIPMLPFTVLSIATADSGIIRQEIAKLKDNYDYILVDGRPSIIDRATRATVLASDLVIVPTNSAGTDIWASNGLFRIIQEISEENENLTLGMLFNQHNGRFKLTQSVIDSVKKSGTWQIFNTTIGRRQDFPESMTYGLSVSELNPNGKASEEINALANEIEEIFK